MTKDFDLIAELRDGAGTSNCRRLRRSGMVPAVIYGAGRENLSLIIDHNHLLKKLASENFLTSILSIKIQDKEESVLIKDIQIHPYKRQVIHLDMQRVIADQLLRVSVPIHFLNGDSAPGVKLEGGTVSALMNEVEVSCLPKDLPERLEVDVAAIVNNDIQNIAKTLKYYQLNFSGKTFLISGAAGFLGNYFVRLLSYLNKKGMSLADVM